MPIAPDIDHASPDDPYSSLADVHYSTPTSIFGNFMSMLQNNVVKKLADAADASPNIPMLQYFNFNHQTQDYINEYYSRKPATPEQIAEVVKDRPGFHAPDGVSDHVLETMKNNWDNEKAYGFIANRPAGSMAKWGGFLVGGTAAGILDPIALAAGGVAGGAAERAIAPTATRWLETLAAKETMGSGVAEVATHLGQAGIHGYAAGAGFLGTEELADEYKRAAFNEPADWLGALQRVGTGAGQIALLGAGARGLGISLFGYERPILARPEVKEGETPIPDAKPETVGVERRGGLLNSEAFQDMPAKAKAAIGRYYKPWSVEADQTARVDAMGQALNGQTPDVSLTLRQGAMDEGARFRDILEENNVPLTEMDMRLLRADDEANLKLQELATTVEALKKSDKQLISDKEFSIDQSKDLSQREIVKRLEQTNFDREMAGAPDVLPLNLDKYIELQDQINKLSLKLEKNGENSQMRKRITQLEKRKPKIETPREELTGIKKRLLDKGLPEDFQATRDYARLSNLSRVWPQAKNLLDRIHLEREHQLQLRDLVGRKVIIDSMRKHVNGTHDALTQEDMKNYADKLNSTGIDPVAFDLPDTIDTTYEAELNKFAESEMAELLDKVNLPEFRAEVEDTVRRRESIPTLKKMAKGLVDCILRNEV